VSSAAVITGNASEPRMGDIASARATKTSIKLRVRLLIYL
jgi:hypothetical protein